MLFWASIPLLDLIDEKALFIPLLEPLFKALLVFSSESEEASSFPLDLFIWSSVVISPVRVKGRPLGLVILGPAFVYDLMSVIVTLYTLVYNTKSTLTL